MANSKSLVRIVALVLLDTASESDAGTIGGNLARQIQNNFPAQYDVKGVTVEAVTAVDENGNEADLNKPAVAKTASKDKGDTFTTLNT